MRSPWRKLPLAVFGQLIGEDEAGGLPAKFLGQFGLETWGASSWGDWRLRAEYADTACNFSREQPLFECGYRNTNYPQGYTYRGRTIGHSLGNDSRMSSIAGLLTRRNGDVLSLTVRRAELNRDASGPHLLTDGRLEVDNVELRFSRSWRAARIAAGIGYHEPAMASDVFPEVQGFLTWQQGF